jgi:hypothetical protein
LSGKHFEEVRENRVKFYGKKVSLDVPISHHNQHM